MVKPEDHSGGRVTETAKTDDLELYRVAADIGAEIRDHLMEGGEAMLINPKNNKTRYLVVRNNDIFIQ